MSSCWPSAVQLCEGQGMYRGYDVQHGLVSGSPPVTHEEHAATPQAFACVKLQKLQEGAGMAPLCCRVWGISDGSRRI